MAAVAPLWVVIGARFIVVWVEGLSEVMASVVVLVFAAFALRI